MDPTPTDLRLIGSRSGEDAFWTDGRIAAATRAFVGLGVVLRLARFGLRHPLWGDEAFLASNLIDRDFAGLMRPLDYVQVCPILFLWIEKAMSLLFGFSEWPLRLVPTVASTAALLLFRHVAGRLLRGPALVLAVAVLAVGYYPIRHGGEIKPYATDLLAALGLIALAVEWLRAPHRIGFLGWLVAVGPLAVAISHPAIFVAGGVGMVLLAPVAKTRRPAAIASLAAFGLATSATFVLLLRAVTSSQSANVMGTMMVFWGDAFPPSKFPRLVAWLAKVHTSHMFAYPAGGTNGASTLTTGCAVAGIVAYLRRGSRTVLALLLSPFALGLTAAFLGRYPYGGSARTMQYVAPSIGLLAGLGGAVLVSRWPRPRLRSGSLTVAVVALMATGLGLLGWDVAHPYKSVHDREARDFAERFWSEEGRDAELACAREDLGVVLGAKGWTDDRSALYLCHRAIYAPRHRRRKQLQTDDLGAGRPLRVVVFGERPGDGPRVSAWVERMSRDYVLLGRRERVANKGVVNRAGLYEDRYILYDFAPREVAAGAPGGPRR